MNSSKIPMTRWPVTVSFNTTHLFHKYFFFLATLMSVDAVFGAHGPSLVVREDGLSFKPLTLVFAFADEDRKRILLGMKKRGFGKGKFNGFGGKLEKGETVEEAAVRELQEESCLDAKELQQIGRIFFEFIGNSIVLEVNVFEVTKWTGEPKDTEEMAPRWFDTDSVPFEQMWADDKHWFPFLLAQKRFSGYFLFDGESTIIKHILKEENHGGKEAPTNNAEDNDRRSSVMTKQDSNDGNSDSDHNFTSFDALVEEMSNQ
eukprot:m.6785 g.6785  ORF g.6785 m.6785 type:complete len:260 (-) comp5533_c0_seq2:84-863(-)